MTFLAVLLALLGPLRFAWLSDTHVGSDTGADDLRAAVRDINGMTGVQFVLISGDVTEFGSDEQLKQARLIMDSLNLPYHVIPGNHDTKWSESGCLTFSRLWGNDRFVFDAGGLRFIGLHEGPRMRMADGHFAPEDLRWLDSVLAAARPDIPLIFVTHYPLDSGIANWYEALDRLKERGTRFALVGHGHRNMVSSYEGLRGLMGRSNLRAGKPAGGFTLVTVTGDSLFAAEHTHGAHGAGMPWYRGPLLPEPGSPGPSPKNYLTGKPIKYYRPRGSADAAPPAGASR